MNHKRQRVLRYFIATLSFSVIGIAISVPAVKFVFGSFYADFVYAVVSGEYSDDPQQEVDDTDMVVSDVATGTIERDEWDEPRLSEKYGEISCERIGLNVPLYYGDNDKILLKGAGQSPSSDFPGQGGVVLIGGHDTTFFAPLQNAQIGDSIILKCTYGTYEYQIAEISVIKGSDYSPDNAEDGNERLVLYTCYPYGDTDSVRTEKILYTCTMISGPEFGGDDTE